MTSDLLEENQDLRKQVEELKNELRAEKEYSATLRKEIDEYTNSHTLCTKYKELEKENALLKGRNEGFELQIMGLLIKYEEVYKRFPDLKSAMDKAKEVLKENAELKEFINAPHTKGRSTTRGDYIKTVWDLSKQLAEAKDLLKKLYKETRGYMNDQGFDMNVINEVYAFINSEVEK